MPTGAQSGVVAIAAGGDHSLALKTDGFVVAWGDNVDGQTTVPTGAQSGVVAIAAGGGHSLALKSDGSVVAWGYNAYGQTNVPAGAQSGVVAIAAGGYHSLALKADGSVVAWGNNGNGQATVPTRAQSGVAAIAAGVDHSLALKTDGSVVVWGRNFDGQTNVPGSSDLTDLTIDPGALNFNASTDSYTTYVRGSVSSVNVTAKLADIVNASLFIGGQMQPSGSASAVSLTGTSTVIPVRVSPYLLPDKLYSITVIKVAPPNVAVAMTKADGSAYSDNTWTNQAVSVSIGATDDVSVTSVTYSLDGGANWSPYSSPIQLTGDNVYSLVVKAIDSVGNETIEQRTVKISTSGLILTPALTLEDGAPYTSGAWTNQSVTASVYAESSASGVDSITYTTDGGAEQAYVNQSPLVFSQEGAQAIVFKATDTAGNMLNAPLSINIDKTRPVITLKGPSKVTLTVGDTYAEQGADATDNVGLAGAVAITGTVNTNIAGTYTLRYNVSDLAGNAAVEVVRTVVVQPPLTSEPAPAPTVAKPVIDKNGEPIDPANLDTTKPSVTLEVTPNKDGIAYVSIPASILTRLEGKNATFFIEIKAPYGSYPVPVNLASLIPGLKDLLAASNLNTEDISFKTTLIDKSGNKDIQEAFANGLPNGKVMGAIVDFRIDMINTRTGQIIGTADKFSKALTRAIQMPKNMTGMPAQWGAFRYNASAKKFEFVPAKKAQMDGAWYVMISSYSNSAYVVAQNEASFADVQTHWGKPFVELAAAKGLVSGVGGGLYEPDRPVTRAEFTSMLVQALGRGTSSGSGAAPYDDVKQGAWYFDAVVKAKELGLLSFVKGNSFKPDQPLTREEMASLLAAVIAAQKLPVAKEFVSLDGYKDIGSASPTYLEDIRLMVKLQIMTGTGSNTFGPKGETTRAQAAVVFIRTLQTLGSIDS
ncbi:S-layer homology domain-containing protein [Cohnella nanjingensis]|uniref:S-layer homology domain-containing protein n=1 Tax=Cohnella nanjingensis TaxID=1387779 RepID=UPI0028B05415|nr:S-layer homology domain-containing protein [Cohnella nanjingensis]